MSKMAQQVLLIDNYDSFTYNVYQYLSMLGAEVEVVRNDATTVEKIRKNLPDRIVISPGPGEPKDAGISEDVIREFSGEIPLLGICLGHQAIGEVFGGKIIRSSKIMHGKTSQITHNGKDIFKDLPNPFTATRYHSLVIEKSSFPECLEIMGESEDGEIMAVRHKEKKCWGVQFHPESILTNEGMKLLGNFLKL